MSVLRGMERLVIVFIEVGEGLSYRVGERSTCRLIDPMLLVILSVLFATRSLFLLKIATQLSSHNCLIDSMLLDFNSGSICAFFALSFSPGMLIVVVCEEGIRLLLGSMTTMGLRVGNVFFLQTSCNLMYV